MSNQTIRPGLTAAMRVGRELHAAGWRYDLRTAMADDTTIRDLLHPSGREIHARTSSDGELTELTMTGLTLEQAADAITAAGLTGSKVGCERTPALTSDYAIRRDRHQDVIRNQDAELRGVIEAVGQMVGAGRMTAEKALERILAKAAKTQAAVDASSAELRAGGAA